MNETWMSAGSGPAHLIRLTGSVFFTTACQRVIARNTAIRVETKRLALAQRPGTYYLWPVGQVCPDCEPKAMAQI